MQKIKGVIFDLDGTLANTLPLCIRAFREAVSPLIQRPLTDEEIIATFGPSEEGTIRVLAPDHYEQGVSDYLYFYKAHHGICPRPFAGIRELLKILQEKEVRIGMVTGKGKNSTMVSLEQFDLLSFFEVIETGAAHGPRKPEGIISVLQHWTDISREEVIYVGDAPSDIEACRNVGVTVIAAAWAETSEPDRLKELQPDELFYTVEDFTGWIEGQI
jgi:phosphoglycolate phosphatase/pyrophosphatase PpaX